MKYDLWDSHGLTLRPAFTTKSCALHSSLFYFFPYMPVPDHSSFLLFSAVKTWQKTVPLRHTGAVFSHPPSCFLVPLPSFFAVRLPSLTYRNAYRCNSCRIYPFFLIFKPSHFSFRCAVLLISFYSAARKIATRRKSR